MFGKKEIPKTQENIDFKTEIYNSLSELPRKRIDEVVICAQDAFGPSMGEKEVLEHLEGRVVLIIDRKKDSAAGFGVSKIGAPNEIFNSNDISDELGLYFVGAAIKKEYQGNGAYRQLNFLRLEEALTNKVELIYTRTQNPRVERGVLSTLEELKQNGVIKGYFLERNKQKNVYGRMLTETKPFVREGSPYEDLNYENGDAFVLLFRILY